MIQLGLGFILISVGICRIVPKVLGTKPKQCKGHSAVLLNEDRILIVKGGSSPDDCTWFLEVVYFYQCKLSRLVWGQCAYYYMLDLNI